MSVDNNWDGMPMPQRIYAILAMLSGLFLTVLAGNIANISLPAISVSLGVSEGDSIWVVNGFQISAIMLLLPFAALGEIINFRKVYLAGILIFTIASAGCALSSSLEALVAARVVQGIGASLVMSVNPSLVRLIYPRARLGRGMGINAAVVAVSAVAGPTVAGLILSISSWHSLFAINIPLGLITFFLSARFLPANPTKSASQGFDWKGSVLSAFTFGLMIMAVECISHEWGIMPTAICTSLFLLCAFLLVTDQKDKPHPLLPLDLLKIPIFRLSICTSICSFTAQMLAMVSLPFYLQHQLGIGVVETGAIMSAWPAVIMIVAPVAGYLVEKTHPGILGTVGLCTLACGMFLLCFIPSGATPFQIALRMALSGFGFGLFQSPNNSVIMGSAPVSRSGGASDSPGRQWGHRWWLCFSGYGHSMARRLHCCLPAVWLLSVHCFRLQE